MTAIIAAKIFDSMLWLTLFIVGTLGFAAGISENDANAGCLGIAVLFIAVVSGLVAIFV